MKVPKESLGFTHTNCQGISQNAFVFFLQELMKGYEALKSSKSGKTLRDKCELLAGMKFTYVVSCQQYGIHKNSKDPRATDIMRLMATYVFSTSYLFISVVIFSLLAVFV